MGKKTVGCDSLRDLSKYEKRALQQIRDWKNPKKGSIGNVLEVLNKPISWLGDKITEAPFIGWTLQKSVQGVLGVTNELAQYSVRPNAIYREFHSLGEKYSGIKGPGDIFSHDLEDVDRAIGFLRSKYIYGGLIEGGVSGFAGIIGIPIDVVALFTGALRATGEYATYCGFDISQPLERDFAIQTMCLSTSPDDSSKFLALAQLNRITVDVAKKQTWQQLQNSALVRVIQQASKTLGIRLTKAKLAQLLPVLGALVGAGFNAYFMKKVCDASFFLYRERFLIEKYGLDILQESAVVAEEYSSNYSELSEELPKVESVPEGWDNFRIEHQSDEHNPFNDE